MATIYLHNQISDHGFDFGFDEDVQPFQARRMTVQYAKPFLTTTSYNQPSSEYQTTIETHDEDWDQTASPSTDPESLIGTAVSTEKDFSPITPVQFSDHDNLDRSTDRAFIAKTVQRVKDSYATNDMSSAKHHILSFIKSVNAYSKWSSYQEIADYQEELVSYCQQAGQNEDALQVLKAIPDNTLPDQLRLRLLNRLIFFYQICDHLNDAQHYATKSAQLKMKLYGKRSNEYTKSLVLLIMILEISGEFERAQLYSDELSDETPFVYQIAPKAQTGQSVQITKKMKTEAFQLLDDKQVNYHDMQSRSQTLHWAIEHNHITIIQLFIAFGVNIETRDVTPSVEPDHLTPLGTAARVGNLEATNLLISGGAIIDAHSTSQPCTPLYTASDRGHTHIVQALLDAGARHGAGSTCLAIACHNGHTDIIELLLHVAGPNIITNNNNNNNNNNNSNNSNNNPDHPANPTDPNSHETSIALHIASQTGRADIVNLLLIAGHHPIETPGPNGFRPLHIAAEHGHISVLTSLLAAGAQPNAHRPAPTTPLCLAAHHGHSDAVSLLLAAGAASETADDAGLAALGHAVAQGHVDVVRLLLRAGACVDAQRSPFGAPAVLVAVLLGRVEMVECLMAGGADAYLRGLRLGVSAYEVAVARRRKDLLAVIGRYTSTRSKLRRLLGRKNSR